MTISDLLVKTTRELARPVEIKPYAPALKSGWMYLHGMNRVTKEDCWLRRLFASPLPTKGRFALVFSARLLLAC